MASAAIPQGRRAARLAIIEEHVRLENAHDLQGVLGTFGKNAHYDDEAWGDHYTGIDGVQEFYQGLMTALPDLQIEILKQHVTDDNVVLEVVIRGTQLGSWRGLPATGRRVEVPLCGVYTFDEDDRLAGERIYYDRASVLMQLGVLHDPQSLSGRLVTLATHPITIARAVLRKSFGRR